MNNPCTHCIHAEHFPKGKTGRQSYHLCKNTGISWDNPCEKNKRYLEYRKSKRKYEKGRQIAELTDLISHEWVWLFERPYHIKALSNLPLRVVLQFLDGKRIFKAVKKENGGN